MDGTFYRDGTKLLRTQINKIQHSKKWKSRFDAVLQKVLKLGPSVNFSLSKWIDGRKNLADNTGRWAFTNTTMKAVENQLEKVEHAEDPNGIDMYIEIPAGKASSHGLSKWQSKHLESALERVTSRSPTTPTECALQSPGTSSPLEVWPFTMSKGAGSAN
jgi:hypothetical protein